MLNAELKQIIKKARLESFSVDCTDSYYNHSTFSVKTLSDFITLIESFASLSNNPYQYKLLYRGMGNHTWELIPSLMRLMNETKFCYSLEHDLAVGFRSEMPQLFHDANSHFERISKMQHFGIPTRLLDFSLNPLIALYFACADQSRQDGRVVFTRNKIHHYDDPCVECVSSLYLYDDCDNIPIDEWLKTSNYTPYEYLFDVYTDIYDSSPLFVKPLYQDSRMQVQRSIFLLFHNDIRDLHADRYIKDRDINLFPHKHECVEYIYKHQLECPYFGTKERPTLIADKESFSRLTDTYRKLNQKDFSEATTSAISNRFYLMDTISPLEPEDIWQSFASIIIPSKSKSKILLQLEHVGIDEAFVYPEAEHLAKRIKKQLRKQ